MWAIFIIFASFGAASDEIYVYPDVYEHGDGLGAVVNEEALARLIQDNTTDGGGVEGTPTVGHRLDLNNDGKAEIFLKPAPIGHPRGGGWYEIYIEKDGHYNEIGTSSLWFTLRASKNNYARILNHNNSASNTDPIWTVTVSAFEGERYVSEHTSDLTMGQMEELALSAYRAEDYPTAEKRFLNLIRCGLGNSLQHENNLALVFMRTKRYQEAIDCIEKTIAAAPPLESRPRATDPIWEEKRRHWAKAHYNLGKAYEALNDLPAAWKHYHAACKLLPTDDRKATLKRLAGVGVDTANYEVIW